MKNGFLFLGLFTAIQTAGFVYYIMCMKKNDTDDKDDKNHKDSSVDKKNLQEGRDFLQLDSFENLIKEEILEEEKEEDILEQLKKLSLKKKELNNLLSQIELIQTDIDKIRDNIEELNNR